MVNDKEILAQLALENIPLRRCQCGSLAEKHGICYNCGVNKQEPVRNNYILYGSSGAGKTSIALAMEKMHPNAEIIKIRTTRPPRSQEAKLCKEYEFVKEIDLPRYEVSFQKFKNKYVYNKKDLFNMYRGKKTYITICGDIEACKQLQSITDAKLIYIYASKNNIKERLLQRGEKNIDFRLASYDLDMEWFVDNIQNFNHVIFNNFDLDIGIKQAAKIMGIKNLVTKQ